MISSADWEQFNTAYQKILGSHLERDIGTARIIWQGIADNSSDLKSRAIALHLLGCKELNAVYTKPLKRWSGGSIKDPGKGFYIDYPDIMVGVFPSA